MHEVRTHLLTFQHYNSIIHLSIYSGNGNSRHGGGGGYQKRNPNEELFCRDNFLSLNALQMIEQVLTMCMCLCVCVCMYVCMCVCEYVCVSMCVFMQLFIQIFDPLHFYLQ